MTAERSAYRILGLRPGAGRAEVNDAYRRLMKRYHPDRPGGDSDRAAEINRAYTLLRRRLGEPVRVPVTVPPRRRPGPTRFRRLGWLLTFAIVGVAVALASQTARNGPKSPALLMFSDWPPQAAGLASHQPQPVSFDDPVQPHIVSGAIADAIRFHSHRDMAGAAAYSSDCQASLRREPNLAWFDACGAFDEAMLALNDDAEQPDSSPFSESAVTIRETAAARILSDDTFAADSHLHEIRSQVDMEILPMLDSAAAANP